MASPHDFSSVLVSRRSASVSSALSGRYDDVAVADDNQAIVDGSDVVVLAVLPQQAENVIRSLTFRPGQEVISLIATFPAGMLADWIGADVTISRAIPLPAVARQAGVTVLFPETPVSRALFGSMGIVLPCDTIEDFDSYASVSALMGLYFGVMETAVGWMADRGGKPEAGQAYLSKVFAELARTAETASDIDLGQQRVAHSTPGGLNQQMFDVFRESGGCDALTAAMDSVVTRIESARLVDRDVQSQDDRG